MDRKHAAQRACHCFPNTHRPESRRRGSRTRGHGGPEHGGGRRDARVHRPGAGWRRLRRLRRAPPGTGPPGTGRAGRAGGKGPVGGGRHRDETGYPVGALNRKEGHDHRVRSLGVRESKEVPYPSGGALSANGSTRQLISGATQAASRGTGQDQRGAT